MLDVSDFIVEKGGDPNKIRESQRRRYAPEEVVDQVIALFEDHRRSIVSDCSVQLLYDHSWPDLAKYEASQVGTKINANQKEIGSKKKVGSVLLRPVSMELDR